MKFIKTLTIILISTFAWSQGTIEKNINWEVAGDNSEKIAGNKAFVNKNDLWRYCMAEEVGSAYAKYEAQVTALELGSESKVNTAQAQKENIGEQLQVKVTTSMANGIPKAMLCFNPYIIKNGRVMRVTRVKMQLVQKPGTETKRRTEDGVNYKGGVNFKQTSLLSAGDWHKMAVEKTGVYKITPQFLEDNNIASSPVSINAIRLAGNNNGILPVRNDAERPDDLLDIPLYINDANNDGTFNNNDYILFYAKGPHKWRFSSNNNRYRHILNPYRVRNYIFLSTNSGQGTTPVTQPAKGNATTTVTSFDDHQFVNDEKFNLVGTGRRWFGDNFDFELSFNYGFEFLDILTSENAFLNISAIARSSTAGTNMKVNYSGSSIGQFSFDPLTGGEYPDFAQRTNFSTSFLPDANNLTINLTYDNSSNPSAVAWLDYIWLQVRRNLRYRSGALQFRDKRSVGNNAIAEFSIAGATNNLQVWDVTNPNAAVKMNTSRSGNNLTFKNNADTLRQYVAFSGSNFNTPAYIKEVPNQNLHNAEIPEMVIVSHPDFLIQAQRLAKFHLENDNLKVKVVTTEQVYNEFSSGGKDITAIRDMARMFYERDEGNIFKYILLFGDGSYDYKGILGSTSDYVPTRQSSGSLNLENSDITDDYYGFMDPMEGGNLRNVFMDLGIGRIPCENLTQARNHVDKIIHYSTSKEALGAWRNRVILLADDVDEGWEHIFVNKFVGSERLSQKIQQASEAFNQEKIYSDAFQQVTTTGSQRYPDATRTLFRKVQRGAVITNYIGHGGEIGLSSEKLLTLNEVNNWSNFDALSLFITVTCEFTRFDDPERVSAGEQLLLNPGGGAIALLSTTRVVFATPAVDLNRALFDTLLARPNGVPQRLGDIIKASKNAPDIIGGDTKLKFSLFGDPALRLAVPFQNVKTTRVNGKPVSALNTDTIKALDKVTLSGEVRDMNGNKMTDFNGTVSVSVFDKALTKKTKVNDGIGNPIPFKDQSNLIHRGKAKVTNGEFSTEFIVPLDITFQFGLGKVSYYATNEEVDAAGSFDRIVVGGFNENNSNDEEGPEVRLFLNDENFVEGGITGPDPELLAKLSDSSGINIVGSGIGHDLVAVLDGNTQESMVLNDFYQSDLDDFRSGTVRFPLIDLEPGSHSLSIRAFDVLNNFSQTSTSFIVAENEELTLKRVLNYPNPFTTNTDFQFEHNRVGQPLDAQVQIFTVSGKLIKTINASFIPSGNRVTDKLRWNGLDDYGDKIGKGVYVYRVKVRSQADNSVADKYEKLVILR